MAPLPCLLNQDFTVAGKTPGAVEKEIRDRYVPGTSST